MRICDITIPDMFQNLVHALLAAEHGLDFQTVDDAAGDGGVDGYLCTNKTLFAIYCPERRTVGKYLRQKIRSDLKKAKERRDSGEYDIDRWVFVTPMPLTRDISVFLTQEARRHDFRGISMSGLHLEDLFQRHTHIQSRFIDLSIPNLRDDLARIETKIDAFTETVAASGEKRNITELSESLNKEGDQEKVSQQTGSTLFSRDYEILTNLFPDQYKISDRLLDAQDLYLKGDVTATVAAIEDLRLRPRDLTEELWGTIFAVQFEEMKNTHMDMSAIERYCRRGIFLSEKLDRPLASIFFKAKLSYILDRKFSDIDIDMYHRIQIINFTGVPIVTQIDQQRAIETMKVLREDADKYFEEAYNLALDCNLGFGFCLTLFMRTAALHLRWIFHSAVPGCEKLAQYEKGQIVNHTETLIRICSLLKDDELLSRAYCNSALYSLFDDRTKAKRHAQTALEIAHTIELQSIIDNATILIQAADTGIFNGEKFSDEV